MRLGMEKGRLVVTAIECAECGDLASEWLIVRKHRSGRESRPENGAHVATVCSLDCLAARAIALQDELERGGTTA